MSKSRPFARPAGLPWSLAILLGLGLPGLLPAPHACADTEGPAQQVWALDPTLDPVGVLDCVPTDQFCEGQFAYGGLPARLSSVRGHVFFVAWDRVHGVEPWVNRGAGQGAFMLADVCPGGCHSWPKPMGILDGDLYFWATAPDQGHEVWVTDGTSEGTHRVTDLCPGACDAQKRDYEWPLDDREYSPASLDGVVLGEELFFGAYDDVGSGLFATDGETTRRVARTCDSLCTTAPTAVTRVGDHLAFIANGSELWWSDGTSAGTEAGPPQCAPGHLTQIGAQNRAELYAFEGRVVYAGACGGAFGSRPDVFDLLIAEPYGEATSLARGPVLPQPAVHDGAVWAVLAQTGSEIGGLWRSDGTVAGTTRVSSVDLGEPLRLFSAAGHLLLTTFEPPSKDRGYRVDLWSFDAPGEPVRLNDGSLPNDMAREVAGLLVWWETGDAVKIFDPGPFYTWNLMSYGENLDGEVERKTVQRFRTSTRGPDGQAKYPLAPSFAVAGARLFLSADGGDGQQLWALPADEVKAACLDDPSALCLRDERFRVKVSYVNQHAFNARGEAKPHAESRRLGGDTGYLWFFRPGNLELAVKVLDGRPVNGHFWVFSGGTTDLEYELAVLDTETGQRNRYHHSSGDLCALVDTHAFPAEPEATPGEPFPAPPRSTAAAAASFVPQPPECDWTSTDGACLGNGGNFLIEVGFVNQYAGGAPGTGQPYPETVDTASVSFFPNAGTELMVKVLDGRPVNGHFWVLWGGLTTLEYDLKVTSRADGQTRTYHNEPESRCGGADLTAFSF